MLLLPCFVHTAYAQVRDGNKTRQIEQLQQMRLAVTREIDTLHVQLTEQAGSIDELRKKLDQLKKESNQDKPGIASKQPSAKRTDELPAITALVNNLQKKFDQHLVALDKTINLQKDLEDKINILLRESNR